MYQKVAKLKNILYLCIIPIVEEKIKNIIMLQKYNCYNLCNESIESFYWLGFILTDGCLYNDKDLTRLRITIHKKDKIILENLIKFLGNGKIHKHKDNYVTISYYIGAKEFKTKYNFKTKKTYNPLDFETFKSYDKHHLLAMFCGIIDGDGSITFKHNKSVVFLRITAHKNWTLFYTEFLKALNINFTITPMKDTAISISIQNKDKLFKLYDEIQTLKLPLLTRKWNRFNEISRIKSNWKPVIQYDLNNNFIQQFSGLEEASRCTGVRPDGICKCCKGIINKSGGYIWRYI